MRLIMLVSPEGAKDHSPIRSLGLCDQVYWSAPKGRKITAPGVARGQALKITDSPVGAARWFKIPEGSQTLLHSGGMPHEGKAQIQGSAGCGPCLSRNRPALRTASIDQVGAHPTANTMDIHTHPRHRGVSNHRRMPHPA